MFILLSHNTPDTLFQFFHPLCTRWVTSASSSPSSANVDPRYVDVFTLFNGSPCNWISASWCSLHPKYSVFLLLIFNPRSSIAVLHSSSFLSTWSLLVLHSRISSANSIHQGGCSLMPRPITSRIMSNSLHSTCRKRLPVYNICHWWCVWSPVVLVDPPRAITEWGAYRHTLLHGDSVAACQFSAGTKNNHEYARRLFIKSLGQFWFVNTKCDSPAPNRQECHATMGHMLGPYTPPRLLAYYRANSTITVCKVHKFS